MRRLRGRRRVGGQRVAHLLPRIRFGVKPQSALPLLLEVGLPGAIEIVELRREGDVAQIECRWRRAGREGSRRAPPGHAVAPLRPRRIGAALAAGRLVGRAGGVGRHVHPDRRLLVLHHQVAQLVGARLEGPLQLLLLLVLELELKGQLLEPQQELLLLGHLELVAHLVAHPVLPMLGGEEGDDPVEAGEPRHAERRVRLLQLERVTLPILAHIVGLRRLEEGLDAL